jgi:hypothetical protein
VGHRADSGGRGEEARTKKGVKRRRDCTVNEQIYNITQEITKTLINMGTI